MKYKIFVCSECGSVALVIQHAIILYCHLLTVWLYHIFARFLIDSTIFFGGGTFIDKKICLYSLILRKFQRDIIINVQ